MCENEKESRSFEEQIARLEQIVSQLERGDVKLADSLADMDARIAELDGRIANSFDLSDEDFMAKASLFIISQQLAERRFINYEAYIKASDPKIVRDFVTSVIQNFCILDGKIRSITFKNGIEHRFVYKQPEA